MKVDNYYFSELAEQSVNEKASLVFVTFCRLTKKDDYHKRLKPIYPNAEIVIFSTAGHFIADKIEDEKELVAVIEFEKTAVHGRSYEAESFENDYLLGERIGKDVDQKAKALLLITDGGLINGTDLINGLNANSERNLLVIGGMAGDGTRFEETYVGLNDEPKKGQVAAIALCGDSLEIASNHDAAWTSMGLEFQITKALKNQLVELNNKNAYEILRDFMHSETDESFTRNMLYYPFLLEDKMGEGVIRTPIAVDHINKTLTYAGNMPIGSTVKLMKSRTMQLLDSTMALAKKCHSEKSLTPFVLAISCVGRRVVLEEMANEEFVELNNVFGANAAYFGFYSYGEFSRSGFENDCKLHNQTLTLAVIVEK